MTNHIRSLLSEGIGITTQWFPEQEAITNLAETFVGMANAEGGTVLLGIAPRSGRVQGIRNPEDTIDRIFQAALLADPPLILPIPQVIPWENHQVVMVSVPPGLPHVYNLDGRYYRRKGKVNLPITDRDLRKLLMERGVIQFESQIPPGANLDDLDDGLITAYRNFLQRPANESTEQILVKRGCIKRENGILRPTYAAILLFGKNPRQWIPSSYVMAARFPGVSISEEFIKQDIGGTLPEQIHQAEVFVRDNLRSTVKIKGLTHQETAEYPLEAIRELLVNAVAHRDYNQSGDGIHIHLYQDRLEVHSPGGLPGPVNLDNLLTARFSRNPVIAQVLSDMGFVERLGYGMNRVVQAMELHGLESPVFEEVGGTFRVSLFNATRTGYPGVIPSELKKLDLHTRQEKAITHLVERGRITNSRYQELCPDVSPETLRRDLVDLVKKGILIKVGDRKSTYYILKEKFRGLM